MKRLVLAFGFALGIASGATAQTADQIADRIERSATSVRYAAVRIVRIRTASGVREFEERILRNGSKQYVSYPPESEYKDIKIYEQNNKRYTYNKSTNEMRVAPSRATYGETVSTLRSPEADRAVVRAGENVAGRKTLFIEFPAGRRGTHRMWIDAEKYVLLKRSFGSEQGEETVGFEMVNIDFDSNFADWKLDPPKNAILITVADDVRRIAKALGLKPMMLVRAGKLELVSAGQLDFQGRQIMRQFYSDGQKRVSLFVMKKTEKDIDLPKSDRFRSYQWDSGDLTLVLIGDFTEAELKQLSRSVKS